MVRRKIDFADIVNIRKQEKLTQQAFWTRYGITQSGGSRYESGRAIARAAAMLMWLHLTGRFSDDDLEAALKATQGIKPSRKK